VRCEKTHYTTKGGIQAYLLILNRTVVESHYRLNVYNSGRPIAEEDREKIFHRFERIAQLGGPTPDGVGLGLCLCREIILEHGGEIWYEARPDGSNFVFTISREDECEA